MTAITFDTLKFVERLKDSGIPEAQAKAIAEAIREAQGEAERGALMAKRVKKPRPNPGKPPLSEDIERFIGKMKGDSITGSYALYVAREAINYSNHAEDRRVKEYGQQLARHEWQAQPAPTIKYVANTVHEILRLENYPYKLSTVYTWVKEVAPSHKPGRRPIKK
jgi:hypothetical protein